MLLTRQTFRDSRGWIALSAILLLGTAASYHGVYIRHRINGPSGGSAWGLTYGIAGTALIIFAMLLLAKKTWRTMRVGSAYAWLQGHVWLGLVSYPIILYHAGWRFGGPLTWWIMVLFTVVWLSGIAGLILQNLVPRVMFHDLPDETVYAQIDRVARENLKQARRLVRARTAVTAGGLLDTPKRDAPAEALVVFYEAQVRPYLAHGLQPPPTGWIFFRRNPWKRWLGPARALHRHPPARSDFAQMRSRYPALFDELGTLEAFVEQRRQHHRQKQLHWLLHGWLLLHIPCSIAMMLLIPLHAVLAMRY